MKRCIVLLFLIGLLYGCNQEADQCIRVELFRECLKNVPAGPLVTHYNDWSEIVSTCNNVTYGMSVRQSSSIKPECK